MPCLIGGLPSEEYQACLNSLTQSVSKWNTTHWVAHFNLLRYPILVVFINRLAFFCLHQLSIYPNNAFLFAKFKSHDFDNIDNDNQFQTARQIFDIFSGCSECQKDELDKLEGRLKEIEKKFLGGKLEPADGKEPLPALEKIVSKIELKTKLSDDIQKKTNAKEEEKKPNRSSSSQPNPKPAIDQKSARSLADIKEFIQNGTIISIKDFTEKEKELYGELDLKLLLRHKVSDSPTKPAPNPKTPADDSTSSSDSKSASQGRPLPDRPTQTNPAKAPYRSAQTSPSKAPPPPPRSPELKKESTPAPQSKQSSDSKPPTPPPRRDPPVPPPRSNSSSTVTPQPSAPKEDTSTPNPTVTSQPIVKSTVYGTTFRQLSIQIESGEISAKNIPPELRSELSVPELAVLQILDRRGVLKPVDEDEEDTTVWDP